MGVIFLMYPKKHLRQFDEFYYNMHLEHFTNLLIHTVLPIQFV